MKTDWLPLRKPFFYAGAIVAATGVETVRTIMRQCLSPNVANYGRSELIPRIMATKKPTSVPLKSVTPSGKKDESFFEMVFDVVRQIPKGRITSYGAIAAALGTKLSARMVGWAMNSSHVVKPKVPAHRVVNRNGMLTGKMHFAYPEQMQELLEKEGIKVVDDQVQDFDQKFWDPAIELENSL